MAVTGKGKQIAAPAPSAASAASKGKRPMAPSGGRGGGRGGERHRKKRRPGVLQFFDTDAEEEDDEEDDSDGDAEDDGLVPESKPPGKGYMSSGKAETKFSKGSGKSYPLPFFLKEEDLSDDELEELIKDRYGRDSEYVVYGEDLREDEEDSMKEPPIWRVKCVAGKERQLTLSLLQKFVDVQTFGSKLQIISVFSLDHVKGFVYFEADKACDVAEACKGFCNVYISRLELVPRNEVLHLLSVREKIMVERDTGRPRGFGFVTFTDKRAMDDAIRDMHGQDLGGRNISVNRAEPKVGSDDRGYGHGGGGGGYSSGGRGSYRGGDAPRPVGDTDCFKCGRPGHWARDCPSAGGGDGGRLSTRPRYGGGGGRGDRYAGSGRYGDDRYDGGRYGDRDRIDSRDRYNGGRDRYGSDRYSDRYAPAGDGFSDRYGAADRYPQNGYGKERNYERDAPRSGGSDRYRSGGPARYEGGGSYRERPGPYDRPSRGARQSSYEDRYA